MEDKTVRLLLGEIFVQNGWITWEQLESALKTQRKTRKEIPDILFQKGFISRSESQVFHLGEVLIQLGLISWDHLTECLQIQRKTDRMIGEILVEKGYLSKKDLSRALAVQFGMSFVDFDKVKVPPDIIGLVHKSLAYEHRFLPLVKKTNILLIAIGDPRNVKAENEVRKYLPDYDIRTAIACPEEIDQALEHYYGPK